MNFRQANTLCRSLCRKYGMTRSPRVVPLKFPKPFPRDGLFDRYLSDVALGHNDQRHNCVELNRAMMHYWNDTSVRDILMHELAHKICYHRLDDYHGEHGDRFEKVCRDLGLPDHIAKERTD